jgi:DNA uptake protein ComE-like DNA-binding protein
MRPFALVTLTLLFALTVLSPPLAKAQPTKAQPPAKTEQKAAPPTAVQPAAKTEPLDINGASVDELKTLPGIGEAYSKKIVGNRPYKRKDELAEK